MIAFALQMFGSVVVGCIHGAVSAFLFYYLKIIHHWDPFLLSLIFGTHGAFFVMREFKRAKTRVMHAATQHETSLQKTP
jgi:hypothetical protein